MMNFFRNLYLKFINWINYLNNLFFIVNIFYCIFFFLILVFGSLIGICCLNILNGKEYLIFSCILEFLIFIGGVLFTNYFYIKKLKINIKNREIFNNNFKEFLNYIYLFLIYYFCFSILFLLFFLCLFIKFLFFNFVDFFDLSRNLVTYIYFWMLPLLLLVFFMFYILLYKYLKNIFNCLDKINKYFFYFNLVVICIILNLIILKFVFIGNELLINNFFIIKLIKKLINKLNF